MAVDLRWKVALVDADVQPAGDARDRPQPATLAASAAAVADETAARVREEVHALPPRDREVVVLRYFESLSTREIAAVTRLSVNAVEVRLHRARASLARRLGSHMEERS